MIARRFIIKGLVALVAAPAIIKVADLMPVNAKLVPWPGFDFSGLAEYVPLPMPAQLDVLYGQLALSPQFALDEYSERILGPMLNKLAEAVEQDMMERGSVLARDFYAGEQWSDEQVGEIVRIRLPNDWMTTGQAKVHAPPVIPDNLALAAAAVAVAPVLLERPVTRRFWAK